MTDPAAMGHWVGELQSINAVSDRSHFAAISYFLN